MEPLWHSNHCLTAAKLAGRAGAMGRWLMAAALAAPLAARAQTSDAPAANADRYQVEAPRLLGGAPEGWGLRATAQGRSVDLGSMGLGWAPDPSVGSKDLEAGYGWRRGDASALIGYGQYDEGRRYDAHSREAPVAADERQPGDSGVLGFSFVLRER